MVDWRAGSGRVFDGRDGRRSQFPSAPVGFILPSGRAELEDQGQGERERAVRAG
ncbi:MAG: hypothetical protein AAF492_32005 [Verrucomicrobiota bacterium]